MSLWLYDAILFPQKSYKITNLGEHEAPKVFEGEGRDRDYVYQESPR